MDQTKFLQVATFEEDEYLRKHVNAVALVPQKGGRRISFMSRKLFNVLLHRSQEMGERDEYEVRLHELVSAVEYGSKDTAPLKKTIKELMGTVVEWQSPSNGEIEAWSACTLLSGAEIIKDKRSNAVIVRWRFDYKMRAQLLSPDRYARLSIEAITQLSSHAAMALYEICARYVDNPAHKTARQHWRWWKPVLTGVSGDDTKSEYRFFKRDVINKAVAEINEHTNIEVRGPIEYKESDNKTISDIQFEVWMKGEKGARVPPKPLRRIDPNDLPAIGRAIAAGVKQAAAEDLLLKHGRDQLDLGIDELEERLDMPVEVVGEVYSPAGWLRENLERKAKQARVAAASPAAKQITADELKQRKAEWSSAWLKARKADLINGFEELPDSEKQKLLTQFREELLNSPQRHFIKRFDTSGPLHVTVRETFTQFLGVRFVGQEWFKPSADDILAAAVAHSRSV